MSLTNEPTEGVKHEGDGILARVNDLAVISANEYSLAADIRKQAKAHIAKVKATLRDPKEKAKAAHTAICTLEKELLEPAETAVEIVDQKMLAWNREQERVQHEAQAKADEEARKQAEAQRVVEFREAVIEGVAPDTLKEMLSTPLVVPIFEVKKEIPSGTGATVRKAWKGECTHFGTLVSAVADGKLPLSFMGLNQTALDEYAREHRESGNAPGYRTYERSTMTGTR